MAEMGIMPPPPGVTPDFHSETDLQKTIKIVFFITYGIATITLILRYYTAIFILKRLPTDAYLILLSWVGSLAFIVILLESMPAGFGRHLWDVTATQLQGYLRLLLAIAMTYIWPPTIAKLSIVCLYYRIDPRMGFPYCLHLIGLAIFAYTVVFTALFTGPCNPNTVGSGKCLNDIAIAQAVLNILTDAILIIVPIPMIHNLHMPLRSKIMVGSILALGSAVVIFSIVRVSYVQVMQGNPDFTWTQGSAAVWSCLELNFGIICTCLATLRPFIRKHLPWLSSTMGSGSNGNSEEMPDFESLGFFGEAKRSGSRFNPFRNRNKFRIQSVDESQDPGVEGGKSAAAEQVDVQRPRPVVGTSIAEGNVVRDVERAE